MACYAKGGLRLCQRRPLTRPKATITPRFNGIQAPRKRTFYVLNGINTSIKTAFAIAHFGLNRHIIKHVSVLQLHTIFCVIHVKTSGNSKQCGCTHRTKIRKKAKHAISRIYVSCNSNQYGHTQKHGNAGTINKKWHIKTKWRGTSTPLCQTNHISVS